MGLALAAGCAGPRVNAWPLLYRETQLCDGEPVTRVELLHPLLGFERSAERSYHVVRPLYNHERDRREGSWRTQYLWPLGLNVARPNDRRMWRFFPLWMHSVTRRRATGEDVAQGMSLLFAHWGDIPERGPYFALFPLGGVTHNVLGDTFSFLAFPLYSYYRRGDFRRHNVLWPVLSWGSNEDGSHRLFRLWPLYVRDRRKDPDGRPFAHNFALWPFVRWGHQSWPDAEGGRHTRRYLGIFPIYANQTVRDEKGAVLARQRRILFFATTKDVREKHEDDGVSLLFGLILFRKTPQYDERRVFPFYWEHTRYLAGEKGSGAKWSRYRAPWPIVWADSNTMEPGRKVTNFSVQPIFWYYKKAEQDEGGQWQAERRTSLWPLVTWRTRPRGGWDVWLASHGWSDSSEGYKRNYRAFFDVFQHHAVPGSEKETRLLWRLYHHRRGPAGRYVSVPMVFSYDSIGDDGESGRKSWSGPLGLVKRSWSEDGATRWRVLYIPFGGSTAQQGGARP